MVNIKIASLISEYAVDVQSADSKKEQILGRIRVYVSDIHIFVYFVDKQAVFIEFVHNFSENMDRIRGAL